MPLIQTPLNATGISALALPADANRVFLYIKSYSTSASPMFVSFGRAATAGTNGELELIASADLVFGSNYQGTAIPPYYSNNCPLESIFIISPGTAAGCVITISAPYFTPA